MNSALIHSLYLSKVFIPHVRSDTDNILVLCMVGMTTEQAPAFGTSEQPGERWKL